MSLLLAKVKTFLKAHRVKNIVESTYLIRYVRKYTGASVYTIKSTSEGKVVSTFSILGFITYIFWYSLFFYSFYKIYIEDQTILRALYDTKIKHYGDEFERISSILFILYCIWKVPFDLSGGTEYMQQIVDIDEALRDVGEPQKYTKKIVTLLSIIMILILISGSRVLSIWISFRNLDVTVPIPKVFQLVFTDYMVCNITAHYCGYLLVIKNRYKSINKVLNSINNPTADIFMIRLNQPGLADKASILQAKRTCNKLKACGKIYSMIYKASEIVNDKFGFTLIFTTMIMLLFIVLYLFYFMEATATGLFHEVEKYFNFLIYVFWQISFAISIEHVYIYFSESVVQEAELTPQILHNIINSNSNPEIRNEALNLSLQTFHQRPVFTVLGLFKLDYPMLLDGARTVTTYLVILLQFVTDKRSSE